MAWRRAAFRATGFGFWGLAGEAVAKGLLAEEEPAKIRNRAPVARSGELFRCSWDYD
jgi:hypothetical protein